MPTWIGSWEIAVLLIILMPVILAFIVVMIVLLSRSQSSRHSSAATSAPAPPGWVGVNQRPFRSSRSGTPAATFNAMNSCSVVRISGR